ncbi:MAG: radical SAM protein [Chitinispirillia bacterium]|nr:radical SAM protein [Chitinispirillia bacterium]
MYQPTNIYYMITTECNQKCTKCSHWKQKDSAERLPISKLIRATKDIATVQELCIVGGEPTLFRTEIYEMLQTLSDTPIRTTIITNGVLADRGFIDRIANFNIHIVFSIDTMDKLFWKFVRGVDSYDRTIENVEYAINNLDPLKVSIQSVLSKETEFHIKKVAGYAKQKKVYHSIQDYISDGFNGLWSEVGKKQVIVSNHEQLCFAADKNLSIFQNGDVYICFQQSWINGCQAPLGNLNFQEITEMLTSEYVEDVKEKMRICNLPCKVLKCNIKNGENDV